ncbi:MFS transporter [Halomonas salipaludis]|uniref:MFS transporter n=1 Tax=Halomonas salipaludis TaxID=2032625 RepID=A0A2A2EYN0_9GAMM|nr:MFS transporter [Halomonas salipaludis]PAU78266.1 MFS transporter [Halomonas salipaludis]
MNNNNPAYAGAPYVPETPKAKSIRFATWIAFLAWVSAVYDFILFGTLLPELGRHYGWSEAEQAGLATWVAVGTAVVAISIGPLVDRLGRRAGIIFTVTGAGICSLLTAFGGALGKGPLVLIRSAAGLGYAEQTVNATYLSELYASSDDEAFKKKRGFIYSLVQSGWPVGALLAAASSALLLPIIGWQGVFIFAVVPSLVIAFMARKLPETPQFEIHRELTRLKKAGEHQRVEALAAHHDVNLEEHANTGLRGAFHRNSIRATLVLGGAILLNWFAIQVFSVLGTSVLISVHQVTFENSLIILILSNFAGFCGYLTHGWLGDRIGRRNAIGCGWMMGGVAFAAMLFAPSAFWPVVLLYSLGLFFLIGPYAAALFFISESFPTSTRASAGALINAMGPIGAILSGVGATAILSGGGNWQWAALLFGALPCLLSGLLMFAARHVDPESVR